MGNWTRNATLIYPVGGLTSGQMDAVATAYVTHAALETFANERLMFTKSAVLSSDYGTTETHRVINSAMTEPLWEAVKTALSGATGTWYLLDANTGALIETNDATKAAHGLDWTPGATYAAGEIVRYGGTLYSVIQGHSAQADWQPDVAAALFKRYIAPGEVTAWRQPQGAHDAYPLNARVSHNGKTWKSQHAANVWEPGVAQWLDDTAPVVGEWVSGEQGLQVGDLRTYRGVTYRVVQNPGANIWTPNTVPALWEPV